MKNKKALFILFLIFSICIKAEEHSFTNDKSPQNIARLNKMGVKLRNSAQFSKAIKLHYQALALSEELNDTTLIISSLNNIGTALRRTGSHHEASHYHFLANQLAKTSIRFLKSRAIALNGLGNSYLSLGRYQEAKMIFFQALYIEQKLNSTLGQAIDLCNIADVYNLENRLDSAQFYYKKSLLQNRKIGSIIGISLCKRSLGLLLLNNPKTIEKGLKIMKEMVDTLALSPDLYHKVEMQTSLARAYLKLGRKKEAAHIIQQEEINIKDLKSTEHSYLFYLLKAKLYKQLNQYHNAFQALEKASLYKDSMQIINNNVRLMDMRKRYKTREANAKLKALEKEKKIVKHSQTIQFWLFFTLSFCLALLLLFVYSRNRTRAQINRELKEINQMKTRFFNNVSHELRTPVTLISSTLNQIKEKTPTELKDTYINIAKRNTSRLNFLVDQLLTLSTMTIKGFKLQVTQLDLSSLILGLAKGYENYPKTRQLNYHFDISESGTVFGDQYLVEILISNLINNSIKHCEVNDKVYIHGKKTNENYIFSTKNSFQNNTTENFELFFQRYFTNKERQKNSYGIGLSLVKEVCNLYGAKVEVRYLENEKMIEFALHIPIRKEDFPSKAFQEKPNKIIVSEQVNIVDNAFINENKEKPLLLIIDDHADMRLFLHSIFTEKYRIISAKDGQKGFQIAKKEIPDLIISDIMMPNMSGHELLIAIREHIETHHIPVIMLTALTDKETEYKTLENKADDYVTKPFDAHFLLKKVENLLCMRKLWREKYEDNILGTKQYSTTQTTDIFTEKLKEILSGPIFDESFTVDFFGQSVRMSKSQLYRKMKAITGLSPKDFIIKHRIEKASILLLKTDYTISEISYQCGFQSASYFSRTFKRIKKITPKEFRLK